MSTHDIEETHIAMIWESLVYKEYLVDDANKFIHALIIEIAAIVDAAGALMLYPILVYLKNWFSARRVRAVEYYSVLS